MSYDEALRSTMGALDASLIGKSGQYLHPSVLHPYLGLGMPEILK